MKNSIKLRLLNLRGVWKVIFCICKEVPSMDATSFLVCAPWARSNGCKSRTCPEGGKCIAEQQGSIARWNLKEAVSKSLVRRTEITYKARLREISWLKATKSNNYHLCSSRVNVADIWRERACTLSVEVSQRFH